MSAKHIFDDNFSLEHNGHPLIIGKAISSGLTGEVYRARLTLPDEPAPLAVAVKVMKALEFPLARQLFYKEGETLSLLMHLEEETRDPLDESLKIAPRYYGLSEYLVADEPGIPYLVMEFIQGETIIDLLKQNVEFSEKDALLIGWHLYRIFDILHSRLKKTFIDLKFENLWWTPGADKWGGRLRMTDFGTLEDIKGEQKRGIARDLLLGGVYLLTILTRKTLDYSLGELREPAEPVIKHYAEKMTWGTRRLLSKLLHRNPSARPQSANEALAELRLLASFWNLPEEQLLKRAMRDLGTAESEVEQAHGERSALSPTGVDAAGRALSALDILKLRAPHLYKESDAERARAALAFGDYFERGFALMQGRSFQLARQTFEEGMRWVEDPAPLRRWAYAAQIGEEISSTDFEKRFPELKALIDFINDPLPNSSRWVSARRDAAALGTMQGDDKPSLRSKGLDALLTECDLYEKYEQAQVKYLDEDFEAAAGLYGEVENLLKSLPAEARRLIEDETGHVSVSRRVAEARQAYQQSRSLYLRAAEQLKTGDPISSVNFALDAYELYRPLMDVEFHLRNLTGLIQTAFQTAQAQPESAEALISAARELAGIGWYDYLSAPEAGRTLAASLGLTSLEHALHIFDGLRYTTILKQLHHEFGEFSSATETLARLAARRAVLAEQGTFLQILAESVADILSESSLPGQLREQAAQILSKQDEAIQKQVDELLQSAHLAILPLMPDIENPQSLEQVFLKIAENARDIPAFDLLSLGEKRTRLEVAQEVLARAARWLGDYGTYRQEEIRRLYIVVENALENVRSAESDEVQTLRQKRAERLKSLSVERRNIHKQIQWAFSAPQDVTDTTRNAIYAPLRKQLVDFIYRCYLAGGMEREDLNHALQNSGSQVLLSAEEQISLQSLREWAIRELNALGGDGWQQLSELAGAQAQELNSWLAQAQSAFDTGQLTNLASLLDSTQARYGTTPEWQALKAGFSKAKAWQAWCDARQQQFQSMQAGRNILRDLRDFLSIGLPEIYWQRSPAPGYLEQTGRFLQERLSSAQEITAPENFQSIVDLLAVSWTKRALAGAQPGDWNAEPWMPKAFSYAYQRNGQGLVNWIEQTSLPANIETALDSLSMQTWLDLKAQEDARLWRLEQEKYQREQRSGQEHAWQQESASSRKRNVILGGIAVLIMSIICLAISVVVYSQWPILAAATQTANGSVTPVPSATPLPSSTPTVHPTPTETPTEMPTPEPIPTSGFVLPDVAGLLYPPAPIQGDTYWLIDETRAVLQPPKADGGPWRDGLSIDTKAIDKTFIYTTTGQATVTWEMDVAFDSDGYYAVYVLDTSQQSKGPQTFQVLLDGVPVLAYRGSSSVMFLGAGDANNSDRWLSLGVYQAARGQKLTATVALNTLTAETPYAVDRLLVVRVNEQTRQMLDSLPAGRTLVSLLDNPQAKFYEYAGSEKGFLSVTNPQPAFTDTLAWNGDFLSRDLGDAGYIAPIQVDWAAINRLPAGEYEVYVWIPALHATVAGEYTLLVDGKALKRDNPATVNQRDYSGEWVSLGIWKLGKEALVGLRLLVNNKIPGEIGVDAVAIVSTGQ